MLKMSKKEPIINQTIYEPFFLEEELILIQNNCLLFYSKYSLGKVDKIYFSLRILCVYLLLRH